MLLAFAALLLDCITAEGTVELKEDFLGHGEFQSFTDSGPLFDRAQGGNLGEQSSIIYGRILSSEPNSSSLFSGFILEGPGSYAVSSGQHFLQLSELQGLNATANIKASSEEVYSRYSAEGSGGVRERFLIEGVKGRPLELGSIYHTGIFEINSSLLWRA
ncbi:MAG: hypothetical protein HPY61_13790 [Methanotrichaceae archaeon]|nr:hypothetical protein [Methanotrichaceae archaeon]